MTRRSFFTIGFAVSAAMLLPVPLHAEAVSVLVEAESFDEQGGWVLDTQFIDLMGSPYLLAHGLGKPVANAHTTVQLPQPGKYRVFVRTKDWVAPWGVPGAPGRFQLLIDGTPLAETFGTQGARWHWQDGGVIEAGNSEVRVALHDLTGFEGRCDAILFTSDLQSEPPHDDGILSAWRKKLLGHPPEPIIQDGYDLVVIGGGYSGLGAAVSAARMGCRVALIQNRPVLGGNGSSEIRVWAQGGTRRGLYPHIGGIIDELSDHATLCPGPAEMYEDEKKLTIVQAEEKIDLFLNHHAYKVDVADARITAVYALDTRTSADKRFIGRFFVDCTGHGSIGALAGADLEFTGEGHMGMTNLWRWRFTDSPKPFPQIDWALDLEQADFPYPGRPSIRGGEPDAQANEWYWETGFNKHPIDALETMRDTNFRAMYGAFHALKNKKAYASRDASGQEHATAELIWAAYIGGPRESRRLMGDIVLTKEDIVNYREYPDSCVPSTWSIDLHHPKQQYAKKFPDNPFISYATFEHRQLHTEPYFIPYRCFYSRNIENLFVAGRCASVTHEALGTVRVMKTCGMMGEVVGKAASICVKADCLPRNVYDDHLGELIELLRLPAQARRKTVDGEIRIGPALPGIVVDDVDAQRTGEWIESTYAPGYYGAGYLHDDNAGKGSKQLRFAFTVPEDGRYEVRLSYTASSSRSSAVPITIETADGKQRLTLDQQTPPTLQYNFTTLGTFAFRKDQPGSVTVSNEGTKGHVTADAVQLLPASE